MIHSIQTKTILLNVVAISVAMTVATVISTVTIARFGHKSSERLLALSAETGKNSLNYYFKSVEQSIETVSTILEKDLANTNETEFVAHIDRSYDIFSEAVNHTNGVLTYYYRIDPVISDNYTDKKAEGYFYERHTDSGSDEFKSFPVTDLHERTDGTAWFFDYNPEANPNKESKWLAPYITANLNAYVVSYNAPIYKGNTFYGVVGIEIGYNTLGEQIKDIKVYKTGFAYIVDSNDGTLIYHPDVELINTKPEDRPQMPMKLLESIKANGESHHVEYKYEGSVKHAYWVSLSNGMSVVVAVPHTEVDSTWANVVVQVVVAAAVILAIFTFISILFSRHFTKPLRELTEVAEEINEGHYEAKLDYKGDDEIGVLTNTVNKLVDHLGGYIQDLNSLAYADALTSVRNKSAFDLHVEQIQQSIDKGDNVRFAIGMFDCDDLKDINDNFGHDKGDVYLKNSCHLICRVFNKSPVFRIGGDEFAIILQGEDYANKEKLRKFFIEKSAEISSFAKEPWEQIRVAVGIAEFNPDLDKEVDEVIKRADHLMYENKHLRKAKR